MHVYVQIKIWATQKYYTDIPYRFVGAIYISRMGFSKNILSWIAWGVLTYMFEKTQCETPLLLFF